MLRVKCVARFEVIFPAPLALWFLPDAMNRSHMEVYVLLEPVDFEAESAHMLLDRKQWNQVNSEYNWISFDVKLSICDMVLVSVSNQVWRKNGD